MAPSSSTTAAITQPLLSLLPSLAPPATYPPALTHLCASLLAQSRQRAAHLKADEEIARAHACCDIAIKRLRVKLRLPAPKTGTAPCPPAKYAKLVAFLEGVLDEGVGQGVKRGLEGAVNGGKNVKGKGKGQVEVEVEGPVKKRKTSATERSGGFVGTIKARSYNNGEGRQQDAPQFVMPVVRKLCNAFGTKQMAPHVYTGSAVVLKLAGLWPRQQDDDSEEDESVFQAEATSLVVALYLMVLTRMRCGKMTTELFRSTSSRTVEVLGTGIDGRAIEAWIQRIYKEDYCKGQEWWDSVPEDVFEFAPGGNEDMVDGDDDADADAGGEEGLGDNAIAGVSRKALEMEEEDADGVLLPGLGTMMQDAVDWTSEERKRDFVQWRKQILKTMDRIEKSPRAGRSVAVK